MLDQSPEMSATVALELLRRMASIEKQLNAVLERVNVAPPQEYYSTADLAELLGKTEYTVREWARAGRIHAEKRATGRGRSREWMIAHNELMRIKSEGLLPLGGRNV
ncbi:Helix-turn-helix domain protein [Stieleria neptunia]|uniref:Helix-turn-helix domain protein n=1 Tax=Stieleria neptunia TaxID=2527979 RepID=A0A518HSN7_9BACT|nr:helix-turn-helix domain-containing protein [Stieleria neptunia]QDV43801.1 Helix-turn-helix domain protein [Stieleria neptunia]